MTHVKKIAKGDKFYCMHRKLPSPLVGTVIALTSEPGKQIGLEFEENVNGHSCDNRGKNGFCMWVRDFDILTEQEYKSSNKAKEEAKKVNYQEFESITLE